MGLYLDTSGYASRAVSRCDRCSMKVPYSILVSDGDKPGMRVCPECRDNIDAWRLTPAAPDKIELQYPRPDDPIAVPLDGS